MVDSVDIQVDEYMERIERTAIATSRDRQSKIDELSSIDQMAVSSLVAGYEVAANKHAYVTALAMALVRLGRKDQLLIFEGGI